MIHLNNVGSAYDIGRQHGASCPDAVRRAYEAYGLLPQGAAGDLEASFALVEERLQRAFPETLEEMRGIVDGSGLSYREVLALNCFDAVIGAASAARECSTIGFADSDAGVLLGKTADWNVPGSENFTAWQRYRPAPGQGRTFIHYGCAGTLWTEGGLNDAGLGMVLNGLPVSGVHARSVPWPPLTRGVLQHCESVEAALGFLGRYDVLGWGFNLMLADAGGDLAFVEVVPGAQGWQRAQGDYLIHTNHCLLANTSARELRGDDLARFGEAGLDRNSRARYHTLEKLVPQIPRTVEGMQSLLRDRSQPGAISQNGEDGQHTVYAMIVAPAQGMIWGAEGYPPDYPFVEYRL